MTSKDSHLYGAQRKRKLQGQELTSSTALGFESQLSSLIASSKSSSRTASTAGGRPRPKKEDIFTAHNRNVKKRALKDLEDVDFSQKNSGSREEVDEQLWRRNKRRMEEKARLYAALKRGDVEDEEEKYGVDFDRKWAEAKERGEEDDVVSSEESADSDEELVEYIDEFGRLIKGTKREAAREERRKRIQEQGLQAFSARPEQPENIIYGDAVQAEAFNPEEERWRKMEELAAKRDKELTPPSESHYDANREIRNRGTGFFQFSADEEERKRQMENLEKERMETEKTRADALSKAEKRKQEIEERRQMLKKKRTEAKADRFLKNLMSELEPKEVISSVEDEADGCGI